MSSPRRYRAFAKPNQNDGASGPLAAPADSRPEAGRTGSLEGKALPALSRNVYYTYTVTRTHNLPFLPKQTHAYAQAQAQTQAHLQLLA